MRYEWDEAKRLSNLDKHGLVFLDAPLVLGGARHQADARTRQGEHRRLAVGLLQDLCVTVIVTM